MTSYISLPMYAANIDQRLRIIAGKCTNCSIIVYPQRLVCKCCGGKNFDLMPLSGLGELYTYSVLHGGGAPSEFDYEQKMTGDVLCGIVDLFEGPRVMARLADIDSSQLKIGLKLEAVIRRLYDQEGILRYGVKFVPETL